MDAYLKPGSAEWKGSMTFGDCLCKIAVALIEVNDCKRLFSTSISLEA